MNQTKIFMQQTKTLIILYLQWLDQKFLIEMEEYEEDNARAVKSNKANSIY